MKISIYTVSVTYYPCCLIYNKKLLSMWRERKVHPQLREKTVQLSGDNNFKSAIITLAKNLKEKGNIIKI